MRGCAVVVFYPQFDRFKAIKLAEEFAVITYTLGEGGATLGDLCLPLASAP